MVLTLAGGIILAGRLSWSIWRIWRSGDKVRTAQQQLTQALDEQEQLKQQLNWVQSSEFVEQEARNKLGYGKNGETIYVVPIDKTEAQNNSNLTTPIWKQWWDLYIKI